MTKIQKEGIVKAIGPPRGEWKSFCLHDFLDDKGKTAWISTKKPLNFNKGDKIKFEYTEMINGEYTNRYLSGDATVLENTAIVNNAVVKDDFRILVDSGNAVERAKDVLVALINQGIVKENLDKHMGLLTKIMTDQFESAKTLLNNALPVKESKKIEKPDTQQKIEETKEEFPVERPGE